MVDPARLRDSTEIHLPPDAIEGIQDELEERFVLTIRRENRGVRLIGSPVEIRDASDFLARRGVAIS